MLKKSVVTLSVSLTAALSLLASGVAPASAVGAPDVLAPSAAVLGTSLSVELDPEVAALEVAGPPVLTPAFSKWWCEVFNC